MSKAHATRALSRLFLALLAALCLGGPAAAEPPPEDECMWFPDIRCGRHGRYEGFVPPVMHPYLFEDPFITTGLSGYYLWHSFPDDSVMQGGYLNDVAVQARLAITDRLAFIATKDGLVWTRPKNPAIEPGFGAANIAAGLKFAVIDKPEIPFILTPRLVYEIDLGAKSIFQGHGGGVFIPGISAAWSPAKWGVDDLHLIGDIGAQIPRNGEQSTSFFYHLHVDYAVLPKLVPFAEIGGYQYTSSGDGSLPVGLSAAAKSSLGVSSVPIGLFPGFEGNDYANLGNLGVEGNVTSFAVGLSVPFTEHVIAQAAYERPVTSRKDLLNQRVYMNVVLEF